MSSDERMTVAVTVSAARLEACREKIAQSWQRKPDTVSDEQVIDTALLVLESEARIADLVPSH